MLIVMLVMHVISVNSSLWAAELMCTVKSDGYCICLFFEYMTYNNGLSTGSHKALTSVLRPSENPSFSFT